jgi:hypothetical protein
MNIKMSFSITPSHKFISNVVTNSENIKYSQTIEDLLREDDDEKSPANKFDWTTTVAQKNSPPPPSGGFVINQNPHAQEDYM